MKIEIPTSYKDVNLNTFIKLYRIEKSELEPFEKKIALVSAITGVTESELEDLSLETFTGIYNKMKFLNEDISSKIKQVVTVKGVEYNVCLQVEKLSGGRYIDLKEFTKTDVIENIHNVMAILCTEKGKEYDSNIHKDKAELFLEHMSIDDAYPISRFFLNVYEGLMKDIQRSLELKLKKNKKNLKKQLAEIGIQNIGAGL